MMIKHNDISTNTLLKKIREGDIQFAGNISLKIYGRLNCKSGKRMKKENRIFFSSVNEAAGNGYRPCGHCMREAYMEWKKIK